MGVLADSHPRTSGDALGRVRGGPREPEGRVFRAEIPTVPLRTDRKSPGEAAGTPREMGVANPGPPSSHDFEPEHGLESPQEDARSHALPAGRHVEKEMDAVGEVDVGVTALKEERGVASRPSTVGVTGPVVGQVGLHFDDSSCRASFGGLVDEEAAEKEPGEGHRRFRKIRASYARRGIPHDAVHASAVGQPPAVLDLRSWRRHGMLIRLGASPSSRSAVRLRPQ